MQKQLITLLLIMYSSLVIAQVAPETLWTNIYGGYENDFAYSVVQTTDGGFVIAGETCSFGCIDTDIWIFKTDIWGNEIWNKTYGGVGYQKVYSIQNTSDGGFVASGYTSEQGSDFLLVKLNVNGDIEWQHTYDCTNNQVGAAYSVQQTIDGGYILVGGNWFVKTDESGVVEWDQTFVITYNDFNALYVEQTDDEGYIIAASIYYYDECTFDSWLVKLDENGNVQWDCNIGVSNDDEAKEVHQTCDGGYIILSEYSDDMDYMLTKTDNLGNIEWHQYYGNYFEEPFSVKITSDGGYIIAGSSLVVGVGPRSYWIVKTNSNGSIEWDQLYSINSNNYAYSIQQTNDDGYIIAGTSFVEETGQDCWLVRLAPLTGIEESSINRNCLNFSSFPNPFNPSTTINFTISNDSVIDLSVFNIKGQNIKTLAQREFTKGNHLIIWNGDDDSGNGVSSGIYYYKLNVNGRTETVKKCLLLK